MKKEHINDIMKTGYFLDWEMQKLPLPEIAEDESSYVISYKSHSFEQYNEYLKKEAPRLQKNMQRNFPANMKHHKQSIS
jgi:hypothetical protein